MSDQSKKENLSPKTGDKADTKAEKGLIIDAEVIEEDMAQGQKDGPAEDTGDSGKKLSGTKNSTAKKSGRISAPWALVVILTAFIGGLFAAPQFEKGLIGLGLKEQVKPAIMVPQDSGQNLPLITKSDLSAVADRVKKLETQMTALGRNNSAAANAGNGAGQFSESLKPLQQKIAETSDKLTSLKKDVDLLAAQMGGNAGGALGPTAQAFKAEQVKLARLTDEFSRLAQLIENQKSTGQGGQTEELSTQIAELQGAVRLARAEGQQLTTRLGALEKTLDGYTQSAVQSTPRGRLVVQLSKLKDKMASGASVTADMQALMPDVEQLPTRDQVAALGHVKTITDQLQETDGKRVTFDQLKDDFTLLTPSIKKADVKENEGFFADLFTVRKKGDAAKGVDKVLYQVEMALVARDVKTAVTLLKSDLSPGAQTAAVPWIVAAEKYLTVEREMAALLAVISGGTRAENGGGL